MFASIALPVTDSEISKKPQVTGRTEWLDWLPEARLMKTLANGILGLVLLVVATAASDTGTAANTVVDPEVLAARESAWRAYFAGDTGTLGDLLPQDFIGISMDDTPFTNRAQTLDGARMFHQGGGRLVRLSFPDTQAQRYGDVVVLYGRYEMVIESKGTERAMRGRLTEIFVKRRGKWVHPGWHLDLGSSLTRP